MKIALLFSVMTLSVVGGMIPGGLTDEHKGSTKEVRKIVKDLENEIKQMAADAGVTGSETLKVISYKTQVVAGVNYFVKIKIGSSYIHVRIYVPLGVDPKKELSAIQTGKSLEDPIEYFDKGA